MKFINYCLIVMGDTTGVKDDVLTVSESIPNYVDGKGLFLCTFSSAASVREITDFLTIGKRNFVVFELDPNSSGFNMANPKHQEGLFGFLKNTSDFSLESKIADLLSQIKQNSDKIKVTIPSSDDVKESVVSEKDIEKMYKDEREKMWNELIDKGVANLSETDKKTLEILAKYW